MEKKSSTPLIDRVNDKMRETRGSDNQVSAVARERAKIVSESWESGSMPRFVEGQKVYKISFEEDGDNSWVNVWFSSPQKGNKPSIVISNPPLIARDPEGSFRIPGNPNRYSEDPVRAVIQMIQSLGESERERG